MGATQIKNPVTAVSTPVMGTALRALAHPTQSLDNIIVAA